jgi:hypothetical protein
VPHVFGDDAKPALAAVAQAITGTTDEARQVEVLSSDPTAIAQFKTQALQIAADREQAQLNAQSDDLAARLGDLANARQQTVQLAQAGSKMQWAAPVVSVVIAIGFFATLVTLTYYGKPLDPFVANIINMLVGALILGFGQVCNYWLGSSAGSARKDDQLANSVPAHALDRPLETKGAKP